MARDPISGFALISPARDQGPGSRETETYLADWIVVLASADLSVRPSLQTTLPSGRHLPRQSSLKTSVRPPGAFPPVAPVPISTPERTPPAVDLTVSVRSFYFIGDEDGINWSFTPRTRFRREVGQDGCLILVVVPIPL